MYYELFKVDDDSYGIEIDEILIRIDCKLENSQVEKIVSEMGFSEVYYENCKDDRTDEYVLVYSDKESFINDYRKIKDIFSETFISLESMEGNYILMSEEEYLKEFEGINLDKRLFLAEMEE